MSPPDADWETVYNGLRRRINQQELSPGSTMPTQETIADEYSVGRTAVRTALTRLQAHGMVTPARGSAGRRVREYAPLRWNLSRFELGDRRDDPDTGVDEWAADMQEQGRTPRQVVDVTTLPARDDVAEALNLPSDELVFRRRRLRLADDVPVSIADTWLPDDVAKLPYTISNQRKYPFLEQTDIALPGGIVAAVGIRQVKAMDRVFIRHASPEEAELLGIDAGIEPVGEHVRIGIEDTGRPFRVLISVFPGSRMYLAYELSYRNQT